MLSINMDDVMQVVSNIQNYLIAFGVVLVLALLVMFAVRKMPKAKKKMIRAQSGLAILLALVVISLLGPGKTRNVILALGLVFIPSFARMARGTYAGLREVNYVKSARLMGASSSRILWRHILPNTWSVLLPALTIGFNNAVLAEASMSYLCIGVTPPDASLGYMLSESQGMFMSAPWYALGTGLTLVWMVFGVGLIGEGLQRRGGGEV